LSALSQVPEILERTLDPRVARRGIRLCPTDQLADFYENTATACSGRCVGPPAGDELPEHVGLVFAHDRFRDDFIRMPLRDGVQRFGFRGAAVAPAG
jgi:hypothetical protein